MKKIIAAIDGSVYADSICFLSSWLQKYTGSTISLLHVIPAYSEVAQNSDISGQIGLGAKTALLEELTKLDEERGKLEQKKGQLMLDHAVEELEKQQVLDFEKLHYRGSLLDNIKELEEKAEMFVLGKRGENSHEAIDHLGSNLERVARSIEKPILVATRKVTEIKRMLVAYDASSSANKVIEYLLANPQFKDIECHLLKVGDDTEDNKQQLQDVADKLEQVGFAVKFSLEQGKQVANSIADYVSSKQINLLVIGAYGHSKIRSLILGSTTTTLIRKSKVPVLLVR